MRKASLQHEHAEWFLNLALSRNDEVFANMAVCLIHQAGFLLKNNWMYWKNGFCRRRLKGKDDPASEAEEKIGKLVKPIVS